MVFEIICLVGLIFVAVTLPSALRRRGGVANNDNISTDNDVEPKISHKPKNTTTTVLAADRMEYFELWDKHNADPLHVPPPIPPTKPHPYFGNEANADEVD
jgi:hypothetical protein